MRETDIASIRICEILGSAIFLERFLEKMKEKLLPHILNLRIYIGPRRSYLECERKDQSFSEKAKLWIYNASWLWHFNGTLRKFGINESHHCCTPGEASSIFDIVVHLEADIELLEDRMEANEKSVWLIIDKPKSVFWCNSGDEIITFPLINSDRDKKIISYPGPHIKISNKRTM